MTKKKRASVRPPEAPPPRRYLCGVRPDGSHFWHPFTDEAALLRVAERLGAITPADVTWSVTTTTEPVTATERGDLT